MIERLSEELAQDHGRRIRGSHVRRCFFSPGWCYNFQPSIAADLLIRLIEISFPSSQTAILNCI